MLRNDIGSAKVCHMSHMTTVDEMHVGGSYLTL